MVNEKSGLGIIVRVNGRVAGKYVVPVREPRIVAEITEIKAPSSLKPGLTSVLLVTVTDKGSELQQYNASICVSGVNKHKECREIKLNKDSSVDVRFTVGVGSYKIVLKGPLGNLLDEKHVAISKAPLELIVDLEESNIYYPDGGTIVFHIYEKSHAVLKNVEATLHSSLDLDYTVDKKSAGKGGFYLVFSIAGLPQYNEKLPVKLSVYVTDALGDKHSLHNLEYDVEVRVSEKFIEKTRGEIETYIDASRTSLDNRDYTEALLQAAIGVIKCKQYIQFLDCREYEEYLNNLVSQWGFLEAYTYLLNAREKAEEKGYKDVAELLTNMVKSYENKLSDLRRSLDKSLEKATMFFKEKEFSDILKILGEAKKKCVEASYKPEYSNLLEECIRVDNMYATIELYKKMLSRDIRVEVPRRSRMRSFKINVIARNSLDEEVDNVYIDFSPAKHYLDLPEDKVVLPPLYPGMEIASEVRVKSLFIGTIVIPYRVCLGDLCIDKNAKISIGRGIGVEEERHRLISDASILVGKSVTDLESLNIIPRVPQRLTREIVFEDYRCSYILGSGGFSVTLLCSKQGVNVVLKIPPEAYYLLLAGSRVDQATLELSDHLLKAFDKEARVLHELKHPNIVKLLKYSLEPFPYLVFEYCEIGDLRRITMNTPRLKPKLALEIMIPITAAVAYAHSREKPIIHMDIKPENILLTRDYVPKLTDFNISRILGTVSKTSAARGYTQGYAAPEQLGIPGYPPPGTYTDVFGLATVIYELITGIKPYPIEVYQNNFRTPHKPKPPSELNPETPRELDEILEIALQTNPDDRYTDATQLLRDLWDTYQQYYYG